MKVVNCDKCKKQIPIKATYYTIRIVPTSYEIEDKNTTIYDQDFTMAEERDYCKDCYDRIFLG